MVKSLLLGTAAGLVAVTAGQAADLPVKAKPVEYVKVCSLYGAGFYYMPGTDMCIKIGGWARFEATDSAAGNMTWGPVNGVLNERSTSNYFMRARGYITADAREQTSYGTARGYLAIGMSISDVGLQAASLVDSANRAFVQWAGITAGLSQSFYDFYSAPAALYRAGYLPSSDTGDGGWLVAGYTAQLGNGLSATLSFETRRTTQIIDQNAILPQQASGGSIFAGAGSASGTIIPGSFFNATTGNNTGTSLFPANGAYGGQQVPDIVGNLRLNQTWGGVQVMAALHEVNATYYSTANSNTFAAGPPFPAPGTASAANVNEGAPSNAWGWAVGAGLKLNFPMIAQGDYLQAQVNYTQGALRYINHGQDTNYGELNGNAQTFGVMSDAVYGGCNTPPGSAVATVVCGTTASALQLTTGWGVNASYEHYWTPQWHESFVGSYMAVKYDQLANAMLCEAAGGGAPGLGNGVAQGVGFGNAAVATEGCNNNWSYWGVGSRLQWDVTKSFYLGVEALYTQMKSGTTSDGLIHGYGLGGQLAVPGVPNSSQFTESHASNWSFTARMHKDFLP